jgi:tetratricopeptide (TPR) repeat protein
VSYRHLAPGRQRFFRLLGLHPGAATDAYAAAALAGVGPAEAVGLLDDLHAEGLLTETGHRRYGMHDLLRRYARDRAAAGPAAERDQALDRLLDYYQHTAARAQARQARQTRPGPPPAAPGASPAAPALDDAVQALAWTRNERENLLSCLDHATRAGQHARVIAVTAALAELLRRDGPRTEAITRHATALGSARHLGHRLAEANTLTDLGDVRQLTGDYAGAARDLEQALALYHELGDRLGQANALTWLGDVRRLTGDFPWAARNLEHALALSRGIGNRLGQANALTYLGDVRRQTGDYPGAARDLEQALAIYRDLGDLGGEADALNECGTLYRARGEPARAERCHRHALELARAIASAQAEARALADLGRCAIATGQLAQAEALLRQAHEIFQRIGAADAPSVLAELNALTTPGSNQ